MFYFNEHEILSTSQFGFRRKHSTYMPVALGYDEISKGLEQNQHVIGLYLDLKKAFDTVDMNILLKKYIS